MPDLGGGAVSAEGLGKGAGDDRREMTAQTRGRAGGCLTVVNADLLPNPEHPIISIAKLLGVSVGTLDNHIRHLQELRAAGPTVTTKARTTS